MKIKSLLTRPASLEMVISGFIDIYPVSGPELLVFAGYLSHREKPPIE
jgi:hypothetical protein